MFKKIKKTVCLSLTVMIVAAGITACGQTDEIPTEDNTIESNVEEENEGEGVVEKYHFVFAEHVANVEEQAPQVYAVVQAYMDKNPNVTIELQGTSSDEQIRNIKMAAQNDSLPELFWMEQGGAVELAEAGCLADLTEDIMGDEDFVNGFLPGMLDSLKMDGKVYGIPCELQSNGIWINKALFDEYGLEMPQSYEDFIECAKVFKENGVIPMAQGAKDTFTAWAFENMHCRYGFYDHIDGIIDGMDKWNNEDFLVSHTPEFSIAAFSPRKASTD